jgi:hypothetical protein
MKILNADFNLEQIQKVMAECADRISRRSKWMVKKENGGSMSVEVRYAWFGIPKSEDTIRSSGIDVLM